MKHDPFFISSSLFVGSFALTFFMHMYEFPASQAAMMDWISWILAAAGSIIFFSGIINHRHR